MAMPGAPPPILLYTLVARSMTVLAECNPYPGNASRIAMDMLIKMQKTDGRQHLQINGFALSTLVSGGFSKLLHHATYRERAPLMHHCPLSASFTFTYRSYPCFARLTAHIACCDPLPTMGVARQAAVSMRSGPAALPGHHIATPHTQMPGVYPTACPYHMRSS
jgi:hypothetical protein